MAHAATSCERVESMLLCRLLLAGVACIATLASSVEALVSCFDLVLVRVLRASGRRRLLVPGLLARTCRRDAVSSLLPTTRKRGEDVAARHAIVLSVVESGGRSTKESSRHNTWQSVAATCSRVVVVEQRACPGGTQPRFTHFACSLHQVQQLPQPLHNTSTTQAETLRMHRQPRTPPTPYGYNPPHPTHHTFIYPTVLAHHEPLPLPVLPATCRWPLEPLNERRTDGGACPSADGGARAPSTAT